MLDKITITVMFTLLYYTHALSLSCLHVSPRRRLIITLRVHAMDGSNAERSPNKLNVRLCGARVSLQVCDF